jgi:hypothetical protein
MAIAGTPFHVIRLHLVANFNKTRKNEIHENSKEENNWFSGSARLKLAVVSYE